MSQALRQTSRTIQVSVREGRLVIDRILLTLGIPSGYIAAMREGILLSEALGYGGFARLFREYAVLAEPFLQRMRIEEHGNNCLHIDGGGAHAWVVVPTVADLATDLARRFGQARITITGVRAPTELCVISSLAGRAGTKADVTPTDKGSGREATRLLTTNAPVPRSLEQRDPVLHEAMCYGLAAEEDLWRSLYQLSNCALAEDSVVSRRHAGPVILLDDGTIVGRLPNDDDFDPKMLQIADPTQLAKELN
jgi:hypothetical protein